MRAIRDAAMTTTRSRLGGWLLRPGGRTLREGDRFPDRTRLEFGPGVSVIVGPNGSGKSNVTDAVLWALGEQSPVAVRGQSMQDVIFGGAPGRQAGKAAEVELVLDDSEGVLGLGAPEVSIVRRLDRSGEGEYRLAGARCRLVDVIELLSDTGLGKEMHSVISQGRVESIVTSKPRDRRMLIEEAAGLGKHRKRRRRAQLKLGHTQDNLDRALDVEREARSRLRPLKRQAEAADLHARLERQTLETRWELSRDDLRVQRRRWRRLRRPPSRPARGRSALSKSSSRCQSVARPPKRNWRCEAPHREELSRRLYVAQSAGERVSYRAEAVRAVSGRIDAALDRSAGQLAALESQAQADVQDPEAQARITRLETELNALERDREAELARQIEDLEQQLGAASAAIEDRGAEVERAWIEREQADVAVEQAREAVRSAERGVETARREAARVGGELAAVNQFLRAQTPLPGAATAFRDDLEVDAGYELALAAALDGRLRAAVVGDRSDGAVLLDRAGAEGGRALVAPSADTAASPPASPPSGRNRAPGRPSPRHRPGGASGPVAASRRLGRGVA